MEIYQNFLQVHDSVARGQARSNTFPMGQLTIFPLKSFLPEIPEASLSHRLAILG